MYQQKKTEVCSSECTADLSLAGLVNPNSSDAPPPKLPSGRRLRSAGTCRWEIAGTSRHSSPAQRTQNLQICKISKFSEFSRERASKNSQNVLINVIQSYRIWPTCMFDFVKREASSNHMCLHVRGTVGVRGGRRISGAPIIPDLGKSASCLNKQTLVEIRIQTSSYTKMKTSFKKHMRT